MDAERKRHAAVELEFWNNLCAQISTSVLNPSTLFSDLRARLSSIEVQIRQLINAHYERESKMEHQRVILKYKVLQMERYLIPVVFKAGMESLRHDVMKKILEILEAQDVTLLNPRGQKSNCYGYVV